MYKRLKQILEYIDNGIGAADIGTDHGYIPVSLCTSGYTGNIYATDINQLPLTSAIETAKEHCCYDDITFLLSDGLDSVPGENIDTIICAGMGGDLICRILDRCTWLYNRSYKLILQPMTKSEILRYYLINNEITILNEHITEESGKYYQIIIAETIASKQSYTDSDLLFGKKELQEDLAAYDAFRKERIEHLRRICASMSADSFNYRFCMKTIEEYNHDTFE